MADLIDQPRRKGASLDPPFAAYVDDEPFIFVSYAHADKALVYPEIRRLHDLGYRIWYDEGIPPISRWMKVIVDKVVSCAVFMLFISRNAIASENVQDEIHVAVQKNKPLLTIHLEQLSEEALLEVPPRLSRWQVVKMYDLSHEWYVYNINRGLLQYDVNPAPFPVEPPVQTDPAKTPANDKTVTGEKREEVRAKPTSVRVTPPPPAPTPAAPPSRIVQDFRPMFLGDEAPPTAEAGLVEWAKDTSRFRRRSAAVILLAEMGSSRLGEVANAACADPYWQVRMAAACADMLRPGTLTQANRAALDRDHVYWVQAVFKGDLGQRLRISDPKSKPSSAETFFDLMRG